MKKVEHKPIIETIINTTAIALTSYGTIISTTNGTFKGLIFISFGVGLELIKYYGRNKDFW